MTTTFIERLASRRDGLRLRQRGFTLLELLVVLAILALLATLVGPAVMNQFGGAKTKTAKLQIGEISRSLDTYKLDVGRYPSTAEGLNALVGKPGTANGWNGPYMKEMPADPWGNAYRYTFPAANGGFEVSSLGADNAPGGDGENADLSSNNLK